MFKKISFVLLLALFSISLSFGSVHTVPFQGTLFQDLSGTVVPNGTYTMTVTLYDNAGGTGTALWTETHSNTSVMDGTFGIYLGDTVSLPANLVVKDTMYIKVDLGAQTVANNLIAVSSHLWSQYAVSAQQAGSATTANIALSLANNNISQFTNDAGYAKTSDIANINVNTANYAVKAGALSSMAISQFSNDKGYLTTANVLNIQTNTANYAVNAGHATNADSATNATNASHASAAAALDSMAISQFTNDKGYLTTANVLGIQANTANYAVNAGHSTKAAALDSMAISQFTNDAGYAKTSDLVNSTVGTANVALSMNAAGLVGNITTGPSGTQILGVTNVTGAVSAPQFKAVQPYQIYGLSGIDATENVVINVSTDTFGFVRRTYKTVVVKGGLVVSESAAFTRP